MIDVKKLKGKIVEKGYTVVALAQAIGCDRTTLYRRLSGDGASFTIGEIEKIAAKLDLSEDEAKDIFFASIVA